MPTPMNNIAVSAFYTEADREELTRINQIGLERIKESLDNGHAEEAIRFLEETNKQIMELHETVKKRYILSLNGDEAVILADAVSVLKSVRKKQFQDEIRRLKETLPSMETITRYYSRLPEPEKSERVQKTAELINARRKAAVANYTNCCSFLLTCLDAQIEALQHYGLSLSGIESLIEAKASEWYTKPKNKAAGSVTHIEKAAEQAKKLFYDMPNSSASHFLFDILSAGSGLADIPPRKRQINHNTTYEVKSSGDKRLVSMKNCNGTAQVTVELTDINKLTKPAIMLLIYTLVKANEQALHNGELTRDYISFPLQSLIDDGLYKTIRSARRGFLAGRDALTSLQIKGHLQKRNGSNAVKVDDLTVPFIKGGIENNQCYIYFNPHMDWGFFAQYFTKIPKYIFSLSDRAGILLYYIFYLARQHTKEIADRGYFTISFRAIHSLLKLPSEISTQRHEQLIRSPIEDAVREIEETHKQMYGNKEFLLELVYDEKAGISEYLDNGYLKVSLAGAFAEPFISQNQTQQKKIQQAEKKKERIEEKAIAMKMAKKDKPDT